MALGLLGSGLGLAGVYEAGQMQMAQASALQISNIMTNMVTSQLTNMASQQKTLMDAAAGIGSAYSNGSAGLYGAIYSTNNEMGSIFKKAGGH